MAEKVDGAVWMGSRCNTDRANILFGDTVARSDLEVVTSFGRAFGLEPDRGWLSDFCAPLRIDIRW